GLTVGSAQTTYTLTGAVNVPIFNGGRTKGRLLEADADLRQRQSEADDLKASIYYELQGAFLDLQATNEQLQVATRARDLAAQELTHRATASPPASPATSKSCRRRKRSPSPRSSTSTRSSGTSWRRD